MNFHFLTFTFQSNHIGSWYIFMLKYCIQASLMMLESLFFRLRFYKTVCNFHSLPCGIYIYRVLNDVHNILFIFQTDLFTLEYYINGSWTQIGTWEMSNALRWPPLKITDTFAFRLQHIFKVATLHVSTLLSGTKKFHVYFNEGF